MFSMTVRTLQLRTKKDTSEAIGYKKDSRLFQAIFIHLFKTVTPACLTLFKNLDLLPLK